MRILSLLPAAFALSGLSACSSSSSGSGAPDHQPPSISNLQVTMQPNSIPVGQLTTLSGTLMLSDGDGDEQAVQASAVLPNGSRQSLPPTMLSNVSGQTSAMIQWVLVLDPPAAGTYTLSLSVDDSEGQSSNTLSFTVQAM
jgi:hypothetical protein